MEIHYTTSTEGVTWERVSEVFAAVGWGKRDPAELRQAFERSSFVRFAYDGDKIVGFGRTMDDGRFYGLIVDLVVDPVYQGKGIGSRILRELREAMSGYIFVTLTAAPGKHQFYVKQGWKRQTSAFIWPRNEKQAREYAQETMHNLRHE